LNRDTICALRHQDWHAKHDGGRGWPVATIAACYGVSRVAVRKGIERVNRARGLVEHVVG
jgi:hypothetical protein